MIWNPGDDTDLNEGGDGTDTVEVNGGNGAEQFTTTANGTRVRFDRVTPAPFSIDIGTSEKLVLNANGGDDTFSATGNLAALIAHHGRRRHGQRHAARQQRQSTSCSAATATTSSTATRATTPRFLGAGDDTFQWDPGDGNDIDRGPGRHRHDGCSTAPTSTSAWRSPPTAGACASPATSPPSSMDLNDVESIVVNALGGADNLTVNDLSGTDLVNVVADLAATGGGDDAAADNVIVNATNGDDVVTVAGSGRPRRSSASPPASP